MAVETIHQHTDRATIVVRQILIDDRDSVRSMLQTSGVFTPEEISVALELVDDALVHGLNGYYVGFVAQRDGALAGYICLGKTVMTVSTWYLYWMCVDASMQGNGIGRVLQSHAEAFAGSRGAERLVVETSSQPGYDRARGFYEAAGYRQVGRIPDFYKSADDCIIYCKELA